MHNSFKYCNIYIYLTGNGSLLPGGVKYFNNPCSVSLVKSWIWDSIYIPLDGCIGDWEKIDSFLYIVRLLNWISRTWDLYIIIFFTVGTTTNMTKISIWYTDLYNQRCRSKKNKFGKKSPKFMSPSLPQTRAWQLTIFTCRVVFVWEHRDFLPRLKRTGRWQVIIL